MPFAIFCRAHGSCALGRAPLRFPVVSHKHWARTTRREGSEARKPLAVLYSTPRICQSSHSALQGNFFSQPRSPPPSLLTGALHLAWISARTPTASLSPPQLCLQIHLQQFQVFTSSCLIAPKAAIRFRRSALLPGALTSRVRTLRSSRCLLARPTCSVTWEDKDPSRRHKSSLFAT